MIIRQIDLNGDWMFGKGRNDYVTRNAGVVQNINSRLGQVLAECFFDLAAGIDWLNLLGGKDRLAINVKVSAMILNTPDVTGIRQLDVSISRDRNLTISYRVQTTYSEASGQFQYDQNAIG